MSAWGGRDSDNGDPDDNGQSGPDPHPENDSNLANFHFISLLSRRHDMSRRQPQKRYIMNVTSQFQSWDNLWNVIRAREQIRLRHWGEMRAQTCSRDYPETGLAADHLGAHKQLRDPGSNARISKLLCLKLGRREGLEVVSSSCLVWAASGWPGRYLIRIVGARESQSEASPVTRGPITARLLSARPALIRSE